MDGPKSAEEILREVNTAKAREAGKVLGQAMAPVARGVWKWGALVGGGCLLLVLVHALAIAAVVVALLGMECG